MDERLEKISIVADGEGRGYRLVLSWMTGGNGRRAEMLPDLFAGEEAAAERARADYDMAPEPRDTAIERRP